MLGYAKTVAGGLQLSKKGRLVDEVIERRHKVDFSRQPLGK